jgi:hypothetical protein
VLDLVDTPLGYSGDARVARPSKRPPHMPGPRIIPGSIMNPGRIIPKPGPHPGPKPCVPDLSGVDGAAPDCVDAAPVANANTMPIAETRDSELRTVIMGHLVPYPRRGNQVGSMMERRSKMAFDLDQIFGDLRSQHLLAADRGEDGARLTRQGYRPGEATRTRYPAIPNVTDTGIVPPADCATCRASRPWNERVGGKGAGDDSRFDARACVAAAACAAGTFQTKNERTRMRAFLITANCFGVVLRQLVRAPVARP